MIQIDEDTEEVRNLAVRSADAVKETTQMVDETVKNIESGNELAASTAKQLEEMASSSKEQAQGVEQINSGLEQIDQVTQSNTANAEESASAAEELSSQAQQLKATVAKFKMRNKAAYTAFLFRSIPKADATATKAKIKKTIRFVSINLPRTLSPGPPYPGWDDQMFPVQPSAGWVYHPPGRGPKAFHGCRWPANVL